MNMPVSLEAILFYWLKILSSSQGTYAQFRLISSLQFFIEAQTSLQDNDSSPQTFVLNLGQVISVCSPQDIGNYNGKYPLDKSTWKSRCLICVF